MIMPSSHCRECWRCCVISKTQLKDFFFFFTLEYLVNIDPTSASEQRCANRTVPHWWSHLGHACNQRPDWLALIDLPVRSLEDAGQVDDLIKCQTTTTNRVQGPSKIQHDWSRSLGQLRLATSTPGALNPARSATRILIASSLAFSS